VAGDIETPALGDIAAYITALSNAGKLPEDAALDRRLLEIAGLPIPEEDSKNEGEMDLPPEKTVGVRKSKVKGGRTHRQNKAPLRGMATPKASK